MMRSKYGAKPACPSCASATAWVELVSAQSRRPASCSRRPVENGRQQCGLHHLLEPFLAHAGDAENAFEMRIQRLQVQQRLVDVEDDDP
jgi:hypothetical protein